MWWSIAAALAQQPAEEPAQTSGNVGMAGHFERAALTMLAVAVGDTEGAKTYAKELARDTLAPTNLRSSAREIAKGGRIERLTASTGDLAQTCAECHLAGGRGPVPSVTQSVPGDNGAERHIMAAMFIWIGLVTPLDQPYQLGLDELLPPIDTTSNPEFKALAAAFSAQVARARAAKSWDERTLVFGEMLQVCAGCHDAAGVEP